MVDYTRLIATAQRLITANGRSITLVEFDDTLADVNEPWLGPTNPTASPESTLVLDAVFVPPAGAINLGLDLEVDDLLKNAEQILICSPGAAVDMTVFNQVLDGTTRWKIDGLNILRPGADVVLAFVGVSR